MGSFFSGRLVEKTYYDERLEATSGIEKVINFTCLQLLQRFYILNLYFTFRTYISIIKAYSASADCFILKINIM